MAIINTSYPVTGTVGAYSNIFPSQRRLDFTMRRKDAGITSISSGTDGVVRIEADDTLADISVGDYVSWGSDAYTARSSRVIAVIDVDTIEVDLPFTSTNASNGFVNYKRNWFLEVRFVKKDTATDSQVAVELFDFTSKFNSSLVGNVTANISLPYVFLNPEFTTTSGFASGLFTEYKVQYRESWDQNRTEDWISPTPDVPIMLVHGSGDIEPLTFSDYGQLKRFVRGYPIMGTFIYSSVNDGEGGNQITLRMKTYTIGKVLIDETIIVQEDNFNGVYVYAIDTSVLPSDAVFIKLESELVADVGQYDGDQYDPTQYQTNGTSGAIGIVESYALNPAWQLTDLAIKPDGSRLVLLYDESTLRDYSMTGGNLSTLVAGASFDLAAEMEYGSIFGLWMGTNETLLCRVEEQGVGIAFHDDFEANTTVRGTPAIVVDAEDLPFYTENLFYDMASEYLFVGFNQIKKFSTELIGNTFTTPTPVETVSISEDNECTGMAFSPDGLTMWILGNENNKIYKYSLPSAWTLTGKTLISERIFPTSDYKGLVYCGGYLYTCNYTKARLEKISIF